MANKAAAFAQQWLRNAQQVAGGKVINKVFPFLSFLVANDYSSSICRMRFDVFFILQYIATTLP